MNLRIWLLTFVVFTLAPRGLGAELTIEQLAADDKRWPKEIQLTRPTTLQMYDNGKESGSVSGTIGMRLRLTRVEATRLIVELGGALASLPPSSTDVLSRALAVIPPAPSVPTRQNFRSDWKMPRGQWTVISDFEIEQRDGKDTVSNAFKSIPQSGRMEYRLSQKYLAGPSACTTIYIMCASGEKWERGAGYLIADALNEKGRAEVAIYKIVHNAPRRVKSFTVDPANGQWIDLRILYDAGTGLIEITRNGRVLGSWNDPEPIKTGADFSLGTCRTVASFKDLIVRAIR